MLNKEQIRLAEQQIRIWQVNPIQWVKDIFGGNILEKSRCKTTETGLSTQQEDALRKWGDLISAKLKASDGHPMTEEEKILSKKIGMSIMSGTGCHAAGTEVLMYDGTCKRVEDVQVGESLMGDDSTPRVVLGLARGRELMYRITYAQGSFEVNENHILSLRYNYPYKGAKPGDIKNITVKEYLSLSNKEKHVLKLYKKPVEFSNPKTDLPIPPYILGVWLGDGCKCLPAITGIDTEIISEFVDYGFSLGLSYRNPTYKDHYITTHKTKNNIFIDKLREVGVWKNKHIPHIYLTSSREDRLELLAGIIDTDGYLDPRSKRVYQIIQKDKVLADNIIFLARSLGFSCQAKLRTKAYTYKGEIKHSDIYDITIGRGPLEEVPCRIERKQAVASSKKSNLNYGFKVEPLKVGNFYGFSLSGNHLYLCGDFVVAHNTGKDFLSSILIFHFLMCFGMSKLLCTANTQKQLKDVLWSECAKIMRLSRKLDINDPMGVTELQNLFEWQSELIFAKPFKGKEWFARACTINAKASPEEQGETLAGRHEDHQLFVLDEASSIPEAVWKPVEGTLTGRLNIVLIIFNPTRSTGFAVRSQFEERDKWVALRWNSEESELVTPEHIENLAKYGKDSNTYRIRVLGLPPLTDSSTLIPSDWIEDAINREFDIDNSEPVIAGIDVGGGGDKSVICIRQGGTIHDILYNNCKDTMAVADWVGDVMDKYDCAVGYIDIIGIGRGVFDRLRRMSYPVRSADSRAKPKDPERFYNTRAEMYWKLREQFELRTISIPDNAELRNQLNCITYDPENKNKIVKKSEIKQNIGHSPDEADAIAISFLANDSVYRRQKSGKNSNKIDFKKVFLR